MARSRVTGGPRRPTATRPADGRRTKPLSPGGAKPHGLRTMGARVAERPRRWRGPGRGAGLGRGDAPGGAALNAADTG